MVPEWLTITTAIITFVVAIPLSILFLKLLSTMAGAVLERPPRTRGIRLIVAGTVVVMAVAAWLLNFRQFAYGTTSVLVMLGAYVWLRNLLHGETWILPQERRVNSEYFGPLGLGFISVMFMWSAFDPFF